MKKMISFAPFYHGSSIPKHIPCKSTHFLSTDWRIGGIQTYMNGTSSVKRLGGLFMHRHKNHAKSELAN